MKVRPALGPHRLAFENPHISHQQIGDCIATLLYTIKVYQTHRDSIYTNRGVGRGGGVEEIWKERTSFFCFYLVPVCEIGRYVQ